MIDYKFDIGELVYTIRKLNRLTQVDFAKSLGVVQSTVSKVEKGFFDDVPFSLISKISTLFKVPLAQFQVGFLTLKKDSILTNIVSTNYTDKGEFSSRWTYTLLTELNKLIEKDVFKELKVDKQYFCISNLFFNKEFLITISKKYPEHLDKALENISTLKSKSESSINLDRYLSNLKSIDIIDRKENTNQTIFTLKIPHLEIHSEQLNKFYSKCFALDLNLHFDREIKSEFKKFDDSQIIEIQVPNTL